MKYLSSISILLVIASVLIAVPDRPAPPNTPPPRDVRIDPLAEKILRWGFQATKWADTVGTAPYQLLTFEERSDFHCAIAATEISFNANGHLTARLLVVTQWTGDSERVGTSYSEPISARPATLIFDRPVRAIQDVRGAKLRQIQWSGVTMNFRK